MYNLYIERVVSDGVLTRVQVLTIAFTAVLDLGELYNLSWLTYQRW